MPFQGQGQVKAVLHRASWCTSFYRNLLAICLVGAFLISASANAQQVYGSIDGNVSDSSGAALPPRCGDH